MKINVYSLGANLSKWKNYGLLGILVTFLITKQANGILIAEIFKIVGLH